MKDETSDVTRPGAPGGTEAPSAPEHRRLGWVLSRHVFRELVFPTLFVLVGFAFVVMMRDLFGYADWLVNRGLGAGQVGQIAAFRLLPVLGQTLPFAVLLGALMALGRLGADQELLSMEASGVSGPQLMVPVLVFSAVAFGAALLVSLVGAPWAARSLDEALLRAAAANPTTSLRAGQVRHFGEWRLEAREVSPRGDSLRGVMLWAPSLDETIFAEAAQVEPGEEGRVTLTLEEGVVVVHSDDGQATRVGFRRMREQLQEAVSEDVTPGDPLDRASLAELSAEIDSAPDLRRARHVEAALQRRFAMPATALVFGALAVPLFLSRTRPSRSSGAALGVGVGVGWFALMQLGSGLLYLERLPVALGVWLPIFVLGGLTGVLGWRMSRRTLGARSSKRGAKGLEGGPARPGRFVLHRYVLGLFLRTSLLAFAGLLAAYLLVDVLDNLKWFTKYQSSVDEVARFYAARLPLLATRIFPVALLVASSLTVSLLAVNGELIALRACGISSLRIIGPVLLLCALLAAGYTFVSDQVLPRSNAMAQQIKRTEIKGQSVARTSAWYRAGDKMYQAEMLDPLLGLARQVVMYELDAQGRPRSRTDAPQARHIGDGVWRMVDPVRIELDGSLSREPVEAFAQLGEDLSVELDPGHLSVAELQEEIREVEAGGYDATTHRVDLQAKLASPLACLVLPAVALLFAALGPPFPTPVRMLVFCVVVAAAHALLSAGAASMGYNGALPPVLAGWASVLLLSLAAGWLALQVRGFGRGR